MHFFDYKALLKELASSTRQKITTFISASFHSSEIDNSNAFINWVFKEHHPLRLERNLSHYKDHQPHEILPIDELQILKVLARKQLKDAGSLHIIDGHQCSYKALINSIADQQLWNHLQDIQCVKKIFKKNFANWQEVHKENQYWRPAYHIGPNPK